MDSSVNGEKVRFLVQAFGDAEERFTQQGTPVANVGGWVRFTIWDDRDLAGQIEKGTLCWVEGTVEIRQYTNAAGEARTAVEVKKTQVTLLDREGRPRGLAPAQLGGADDDDIPF